MPKVSVIIPTYNNAQYIIEAVESILNQTYKDFEIIVVDDGSVDNTKEILSSYISSGKIKYIFQENKGVAAARNTAIKEAEGDYICLLDADDISLPYRLEIETLILNTHKDVQLVFSPVLIFDNYSKNVTNSWGGMPLGALEICKKTFFHLFWNGDTIPTSSVMLRKQIFENGFNFNPFYKIGEDYHFYLSISWNNPFFCYAKPLALKRASHPNHLVTNLEKTQNYEKALLKDVYTNYKSQLALSNSDFSRAISNSYLRDFYIYLREKKSQKAFKKLFFSFAAYPFNPRIYKILLLRILYSKWV